MGKLGSLICVLGLSFTVISWPQDDLTHMPKGWWLDVPSSPMTLLANSRTGFTEWKFVSSGEVIAYQIGCVDPSTYHVVRREAEVKVDFETRGQALLIRSFEERAGTCKTTNSKLAVVKVRFRDSGVWSLGEK